MGLGVGVTLLEEVVDGECDCLGAAWHGLPRLLLVVPGSGLGLGVRVRDRVRGRG